MDTRVEIFRDGLWRRLRLQDQKAIKYNALINLIGKIKSREISHTNTFVLPSVFENTQALGVNSFNKSDLARALNSKFKARFYVEDKLLQEGFLIINNTTNGEINVNFIDGALDITEKWGSITFRDLLISKEYIKPPEYQKAIVEMKSYLMDKTSVLEPLSEVEGRGYNLALFPNNLNAIGDTFQENEEGYRIDNAFNPYQSRPIFNTKALFDLAVETFGYTPIYDPSIDWEKVAKTYMVDEGLNESERGDGDLERTFPVVYEQHSSNYTGRKGSGTKTTPFTFVSEEYALKPRDIQGWRNPPGQLDDSANTIGAANYLDEYCVFKPEISGAAYGTIKYTAVIAPINGDNKWCEAYSVWENEDAGGPVVFKKMDAESNRTITEREVELILDKAELRSSPRGSNGSLIGVIASFSHRFHRRRDWRDDYWLYWTTVKETYILEGVISYDEYGQYIADAIDLTHAAPRAIIKELLTSVMQKEGILMNINSREKTVKFFSYEHYRVKKNNGEFYDWSEYLRKYSPFTFNTDYGDSYAKKNEIGLAEPYNGNTFFKNISNKGEESKYKDFTQNLVEKFKDVASIISVENSVYPYFEYENQGLGLIEYVGENIDGLNQVDATGSRQGYLKPLPLIANVNYSILPEGVKEWYHIVENAVKGQATFLLPVDVVRNLDLSTPIYVEEMGGFYIIEEVSEYMNPQTEVKVKLIKLIDETKEKSKPNSSSINLAGSIQGGSFYEGSLVKIQPSKDIEGKISWKSNFLAELDNDYAGQEFGVEIFTGSIYEATLELADRTLNITGTYLGKSTYIGLLSKSKIPYQDNILRTYLIPLSELSEVATDENIETLISEWFTTNGITITETENIGWETTE